MRVKRNGFTLMELGVLLAVLALGVAYVAPDFMEKARGELSVRTAKEMAGIMDASKWFYMNQGGEPAVRYDMHWPGEVAGVGGLPPTCANTGTGANDLLNAGYVADFTNPWGHNYDITVDPDLVGGESRGCRLVVATNVPDSVAGEIVTYMPMATCTGGTWPGAGCPGLAPAGFTRCCTKVVRPGQEIILQDWIEPTAMCGVMRGGDLDDDGTGKCDVRAKWQLSSCHYVAAGASCPEGWVAVGNRRQSCGKYCEETLLKCCRGAPP